MIEPQAGHNSKEQLKAIIERIENVEVQIKDLGSDRSNIYKEAAGNGFHVKALKALVKHRKEDAAKREEMETILATYMSALGIS